MRRIFAAILLCVLGSAVLGGQQGRDLSKLDACKILPAADVAATVKRKIMKALGEGLHCMYTPEAPQAIADAYDFYLAEAAVTEMVLKIPGEKGTPVPGLWTEAYVAPATGTTGLWSLVALKKGDLAIEIKGIKKDDLIALARLAVSRLQ